MIASLFGILRNIYFDVISLNIFRCETKKRGIMHMSPLVITNEHFITIRK